MIWQVFKKKWKEEKEERAKHDRKEEERVEHDEHRQDELINIMKNAVNVLECITDAAWSDESFMLRISRILNNHFVSVLAI